MEKSRLSHMMNRSDKPVVQNQTAKQSSRSSATKQLVSLPDSAVDPARAMDEAAKNNDVKTAMSLVGAHPEFWTFKEYANAVNCVTDHFVRRRDFEGLNDFSVDIVCASDVHHRAKTIYMQETFVKTHDAEGLATYSRSLPQKSKAALEAQKLLNELNSASMADTQNAATAQIDRNEALKQGIAALAHNRHFMDTFIDAQKPTGSPGKPLSIATLALSNGAYEMRHTLSSWAIVASLGGDRDHVAQTYADSSQAVLASKLPPTQTDQPTRDLRLHVTMPISLDHVKGRVLAGADLILLSVPLESPMNNQRLLEQIASIERDTQSRSKNPVTICMIGISKDDTDEQKLTEEFAQACKTAGKPFIGSINPQNNCESENLQGQLGRLLETIDQSRQANSMVSCHKSRVSGFLSRHFGR